MEYENNVNVSLISSIWKHGMLNVELTCDAGGYVYEGINIVIRNLEIGNKYKVKFRFKPIAKFAPEISYGKYFGYKISPSLVNNYQTYDNDYIPLEKSEEFTEYNTEFVASSETEYLVFNFTGFLDGKTYDVYIYDIEIIE